MDFKKSEIDRLPVFQNVQLLSDILVEGFLNGAHKSPFHGFSSEFSEHKIYNSGDSTRHIDWKTYAKTDKLFIKQFEEESNMRCHIVVDNSSSMHYPIIKTPTLGKMNKIAFTVLASATLINLIKRQRDAVGLSIYSDKYEFYAPEKTSERHRQLLMNTLAEIINKKKKATGTKTYKYLHQIAQKIHKRAMIIVFSDMFSTNKDEKLFNALRHLKYNKHQVVLFHVNDKSTELDFSFDSSLRKFIDLETGKAVSVFPERLKNSYITEVEDYIYNLKMKCSKYNINYMNVDISEGFEGVLNRFLIQQNK